MALDPLQSILYILLGTLIGIVYGLRRIFILEHKIDKVIKRIEKQERKELQLLQKKRKRR